LRRKLDLKKEKKSRASTLDRALGSTRQHSSEKEKKIGERRADRGAIMALYQRAVGTTDGNGGQPVSDVQILLREEKEGTDRRAIKSSRMTLYLVASNQQTLIMEGGGENTQNKKKKKKKIESIGPFPLYE